MAGRSHCPSCKHRISPYALECSVCGLSLERRPLPRPLLFRASALQERCGPVRRINTQGISAPALGRVTPVVVPPLPPPPEAEMAALPLPGIPEPLPALAQADEASIWPVVRLELGEFVLLILLNGALALLSSFLLGAAPLRVYRELWPLLLAVHLAHSWALFMIPLALAGQSPLMGRMGLLIASPQPEQRLAFSLFHLLSVGLFPLSLLCMALSPQHRTLAEYLTGQEILSRPLPRLR